MTVWTGGGGDRLAPALLTLLQQLQRAYPGQQWQNSPQTGTIGDTEHRAEGSASDHNPWLDHTVRALDVAADVTGVPALATVTDAPDCEALFQLVNQLYAAQDPRVFPDGYAIYRRRITDPARPGAFKPTTTQDPHLYHVHISVSRDPAGFNSTAPWPLPIGENMTITADQLGPTALGQIRALLAASAAAELATEHTDIAGTMVRIRDVLVPAVLQILQLEKDNNVAAIAAAVAARVGTGQDGITVSQLATAFADELERRIAAAAATVTDAATVPPAAIP